MRVHVAFTPDEAAAAPTGIVIDVIRATSTICQALAAGYERVWCAAEVEDARALRSPEITLGGERRGVRIEGFDLGNSPAEYVAPRTPALALSTTNGTRAIVTAAARCDRVLIASLLNLDAVTRAAAAPGEDVAVFCAGVRGAFALDDAYVAGRLAESLEGDRSDAAEAAVIDSRRTPSMMEIISWVTFSSLLGERSRRSSSQRHSFCSIELWRPPTAFCAIWANRAAL